MQKNLPYILISFGISLAICLLSSFDVYDNFEHSLLDMRFKSRGLIKTRDDIATADIDVRALQTEGKWDPWSREKHIPLVKLAQEHSLDAFIFDVYFIEESERKLEYKELKEHKIIHEGMLPKMKNAFDALNQGVSKVAIGKPEMIGGKIKHTSITL